MNKGERVTEYIVIWIPLSEFNPPIKDNRLYEIKFPDGSCSRTSAGGYEVITKSVRWLVENNHLKQNHYPIQVGKTRYILADNPVHSNDTKFAYPKKVHVNGRTLFVETNFIIPKLVEHTRTIIKQTGQDPSQFKIGLPY